MTRSERSQRSASGKLRDASCAWSHSGGHDHRLSHLRSAAPSDVRRCSQSIAVCSRGWFSLNQQLFYVQVIPAINVDASERMQSQPFYSLHPQTRNGTGIRIIRELYIGDHVLAKAQLCTAPELLRQCASSPEPFPAGLAKLNVESLDPNSQT